MHVIGYTSLSFVPCSGGVSAIREDIIFILGTVDGLEFVRCHHETSRPHSKIEG